MWYSTIVRSQPPEQPIDSIVSREDASFPSPPHINLQFVPMASLHASAWDMLACMGPVNYNEIEFLDNLECSTIRETGFERGTFAPPSCHDRDLLEVHD